jgi:hypothetical protein
LSAINCLKFFLLPGREHSEKRELLEKTARAKLQAEVLNLQEINREIRERHDSVMAQVE